MALSVDFSKKTFAVITGASQGIGRTLAVELSRLLGNDSTISLIARSEKGLNETKQLINEANKNITVKTHAMDLTKPSLGECEEVFNQIPAVDLAVIFHNVGQIGTLNLTTELTDIQTWRDYFDLNVFSVGILNSVFTKKLRNVAQRLLVVNITSLCGRQPFQNMAMYGSGKAARELYFRVFALEEGDISVLNYSPGPVDTAMVGEVVSNIKHEGVKAAFVEMIEKKTILTPLQTVDKLLTVLKQGDFKSGDVIDYFDRV